MKETTVTDRLSFLAEQFDVFDCSKKDAVEKKLAELKKNGFNSQLVNGTDNTLLAITSWKLNEKERTLKKISVCSDVFSSMIAADPTENRMYLQWMLTVFTRLLKDGSESNIAMALRFVMEDLPQANAYLILFEDNKRKKKFSDLCKGNYTLLHVKDPTNINQYKSLSQLFDAIDPFIEREPSAVERTLKKFVEIGQADMPVKDRKFTLYIPKTTAASVIFDKWANWCTAKENNGMFDHYTKTNKKPNGKNSDIYIIINNKFFAGESKELYQIHFETKQLKDRLNGQNVSIFETVLTESEGMTNYFYQALMAMAKSFRGGIDENMYLDFLINFGFAESLFEMMEEDTKIIKFMIKDNSREIPKLPDISRFKLLNHLIISGANMVDLHPSIGQLTNLQLLSLPNNRIKSLPKEIGILKRLEFINLVGNQIKEIPDEIGNLDKSNGGNLFRIGVREKDIGVENFRKLKKLLPTTNFS